MSPECHNALEKASNGSLKAEAKERILRQLRADCASLKEHIESTGTTDAQVKSGFFTKVASILKG